MLNKDVIKVTDLHVVRGRRTVIPGMNLTVPVGSITGLLGPSGCGKTTLIRAIAGIQIINSGSVTVFDQQAGSTSNRDRVAYVTQVSSVYSDLTVAQNLRYFARLGGASSSAVSRVLDEVGLTDQKGDMTGYLSGVSAPASLSRQLC
ncbi:ATP-binding cassette domain-containing protein [Nesterenkonia haasae]|uniref:ATP-binding cassette domain-containing protein n=1 Tax=Nesterenkonia haasae TaxID=2587813 RepID=UPI001F2E1671|nr:ATP-binding cassette domain-containing protein [Nesterenkonia haasae]